jgi:methylated-DNA-[protein]-cysteine S-methyltransferase
VVELGSRAVDTPLGRVVIEASREGLTRIQYSDESVNDCGVGRAHLDAGEAWLTGYFDGSPTGDPKLDFSNLTRFRAEVSRTLIRGAGFGEVVSYGELATAAGSPRASRAVGSAMADNPWTLLVPCHRVVRSDGVIGNYSALDGGATKRWLLSHEGQKFDSLSRLVR